MTRIEKPSGIHLLFLLLLGSFSAINAQITLENTKIKLITDGKHIISLYDKERGLEHITTDYTLAGGLFGVNYLDTTTLIAAGTVNASQFTTVTVLNSGPDKASFSYDNSILTATVGVKLKANEAEAAWTISLHLKNTAQAFSQVDFPRFRTAQSYGGTIKNFVDPNFEGRMDPMNTAWTTYTRFYPSGQGLQLSACISKAGGIAIWCDDTKGYAKSFGFLNSGTASHLGVRHLMPYGNLKPGQGQNWETEYNTIITLCGNTWQDAADIYRNWAVTQTWSATPFRRRTDITPKFHIPVLVMHSDVSSENLSSLPTTLQLWADRLGATILYRPTYWEKYGVWCGIDYFPSAIGDENLKNLNNQLKLRNMTTAGFIEGYHWVTSLDDATPTINAEIHDFYIRNNGDANVRTMINGKPYTREESVRNVSFLCRGTELGKTFMQGVAKGLFDRNVTHVHNDFDHLTGPNGPCFNKAHGHPIPYSTWENDIMHGVYQEITREAKTRNLTDFSITKEWPSEVFNMDLHGYQARYWKIVSSQTESIPLFAYVYHEYIPCIFGLCTANEQNSAELAASIIYGQITSLAFWNGYTRIPGMGVNSENILKDQFSTMKTHSKGYLLYGKMLKPIVQSAPGAIHMTYQDSTGNIGVFAIDTLETNTSLVVKVPGNTLKRMKVYLGSTLLSTKDVLGGSQITWNLAKWRLGSIVFSDQGISYPFAFAGRDTTVESLTIQKDSVILIGKGIDDVQVSSFLWTKISGPACTLLKANSDTLIVGGAADGTYKFRLSVTDNTGGSAADTVQMTLVCKPCRTPLVSAGTDRSISLPKDTVRLKGTASVEMGTVSGYVWTKVSGPAATLSGTTSSDLTVGALEKGNYEFKLQATSNAGYSASDLVKLKVFPAPDTIKKSTAVIQIDGVKENSWCSDSVGITTQVVGWLITKAYVNFQWDDTCLYAFIEVKDGYKISDSNSEWWNDDAIEIFVDANNSRGVSYDENDFHFAFRWNDLQMYETEHGTTSGINWKIKGNTKGYDLEVAFPWQVLQVHPLKGENIGMEITVINDDDGWRRDAKKAYFGFSGAEVDNPSSFGSFSLGNPCTMVSNGMPLKSQQFSVYPNLTDRLVTIETKNGRNTTLTITNMSGKILMQKNIRETTTLDISDFPEGSYILNLQNKTENEIHKIIKY